MLEVIAECYQLYPFFDRIIVFDQLNEIAEGELVFGRTNEAVSVDFGYSLA